MKKSIIIGILIIILIIVIILLGLLFPIIYTRVANRLVRPKESIYANQGLSPKETVSFYFERWNAKDNEGMEDVLAEKKQGVIDQEEALSQAMKQEDVMRYIKS